MKHEYLIELLKQNKTVIVPNLGAFSNNENPHHPFLFNEYLKFNDGMMAKHISTKEGTSLEAAGEIIEKFTNDLKGILSSGKEVVIPGIGTLQIKDGKTILTSPFAGVSGVKEESKKTETPKAEAPKIEPPKVEVPKADPPKVEAPKIDSPKVETPKAEVPKVDPPKVETPKAEIPKADPPKVEVPKVEIPKAEAPKIDPPKADPDSNRETKADITKTESKKVEKPKEKKEKKKSRKLIWIILLILLLGGGGTAGYIFREEIMKIVGMGEGETAKKESSSGEKESNQKESDDQKTESNETTEATSENTSQDSIATEETPIEKPVEEPVKEEPVIEETPKEEIKVVADNTSTPGTYYIIVGCFQEQRHADNMIAKISAAGLSPNNVGTFDGLQHIAAGSASDLESALQQATSIRGSFPKLWIFKR